jgi:hypothetical protein
MLLRIVPPSQRLLMPAAKMLYALSKDSANDARFRHHGVLRPLLAACEALSVAVLAHAQQRQQQELELQHVTTALLYCSGCLKNVSADATNQKSLGRLHGIQGLAQVLAQQAAVAQASHAAAQSPPPPPPQQQQQLHRQREAAAQVCLQVTAILRNLAVAPANAALFAQQGGAALHALLSVLRVFADDQDVALNVTRCLSKLSAHPACQACLLCSGPQPPQPLQPPPPQAVAVLAGLLLRLEAATAAPKQLAAAVRAAYVLGNLTASCAEARSAVAGVPGVLDALPQLVLGLVQHRQAQQAEHKHTSAPAAAEAHAAADELVGKLLRLLANVAIDARAGAGLAAGQVTADALAAVLGSCQFEQHEEVVLNAVAAVTNLAFYDTPGSRVVAMDADALLLWLLPLLTSGSDEAAVGAARALGNVARAAPGARAALLLAAGAEPPAGGERRHAAAGPYVLRALAMLLDHSSWGVVGAVAGALVNVAGAPGAGAALRGAGLASALTRALQRACACLCAGGGDGGDDAAACGSGSSSPDAEQAVAASELLLQCVANMAAASAAAVSDAILGTQGPRCAEVSCGTEELAAFGRVVRVLRDTSKVALAEHVATRLSELWGV